MKESAAVPALGEQRTPRPCPKEAIMVVYVNQMGSDRTELMEVLIKEGVTYQECPGKTEREMGGMAETQIMEISANLPEVNVPPQYTGTVDNPRAWRLPSGKLIITDLEGNLEQIAPPPPGR